jgi:hypothetical protein
VRITTGVAGTRTSKLCFSSPQGIEEKVQIWARLVIWARDATALFGAVSVRKISEVVVKHVRTLQW